MKTLLSQRRKTQYSVFDDAALLRHLDDREITYSVDDDGFIDILPDSSGRIASVIISDQNCHVKLEKLRSCGCISAFAASSFEVKNLEKVDGYLDCRSAKKVDFENLKIVNGSIHAQKAKRFIANNLEVIGGQTHIRGARMVRMDQLRDSKDLYLNHALSGKQMGALKTAAEKGEHNTVSLFNQNTGMVKFPESPWMMAENAQEMIKKQQFNRKKPSPQLDIYSRFLKTCLQPTG